MEEGRQGSGYVIGVLLVVLPVSRGTGCVDRSADALAKLAVWIDAESASRVGCGYSSSRHGCLTQLGALSTVG